jgi:hypothetical protein
MDIDQNRRFVHTKHVDEAGAWYTLDNAGVIMPAVTDEVSTGMFRIEINLTDPVDPEIMKRALGETANRFPYFNVTLKRGFFWYYLNQCNTSPPLFEDDGSPCQLWNVNRSGTRMFRVRISKNRVAGEFSHALTDGSGGMSFMKTLIVRYFVIKGIDPNAELGRGEFADILPLDSQPDRDEYEDGYQKYFPGKLPNPEPNPRAWHIRWPRLPEGGYRITQGSIDLGEAIQEAKKRGVSLTELLGAVYLDVLQTLWFSEPRKPKDHFICVEIPVNLRQFFPTGTNRNFSLFILLKENLHLGKRDFEELTKRAHYQMRLENDSRSIARQISRNAGGTRNLFVRMLPLVLKDVAARILFAKLGETMLSGFISNIGAIKMPPGIRGHIQSFGFVPAPSKTTLTNAAVCSWNDTLILSFGSLARSRELEKLFFRKLRSLGLAASVRCRDDEE